MNLDTGVLIRIERTGDPRPLQEFGRERPLLISSITAAELLIGVHRADSPQREQRRRAQVEGFLSSIPVLPFTLSTARIHAKAKVDLSTRGLTIGAHDLISAATALEHGHDVVTTNRREFERVPGLKVIDFPPIPPPQPSPPSAND